MKKSEPTLPTPYQREYRKKMPDCKRHRSQQLRPVTVPMPWRYLITVAVISITCLVFPVQQLIAQLPPPVEQPVPEQPTEKTEAPDNKAETQQETSATERLDPEQMTPEEGMVIGDGDDVIMQDNFVQIHGDALIKFEDVILRADYVWADFNDNLMRASGNVHLKVGDEETYSDELVFNLETKKGIARNGFTFSDPWYFGGSEIFKIEDDKSYVRGGTLTTCSLKYPHYYFSVSEVIVRMNQEMIAKNIVLRIGGFPLFYFPAIRRDLRKGKIAKIIVKVGTDSYQGPYTSIILPLARKRRYDGALLYDRSSRRGQGFGFESKYRFNDTQFREIYIPIPPDATSNQRSKLDEKAKELHERLQGEYDRYWLKQLFLEYKITDEDVNRAKEKAEELLKQLKEEDADFAQLAQQNSDHETRYEGGDMGFLVPGEQDADGNPLLDPILEETAFQLEEGELSPILKTESAFHLLKIERVLDIYGQREVKLQRIDIAIAASTETQQALREIGDKIHERALLGEPFEQLDREFPEATLSELNEGKGLLLNEMESGWQYSVRRLEEPGDVTQRRPVSAPEGLYIFKLIEKAPTPTFEELAEQFEAEWETFQEEVMRSTTEETAEDTDTQQSTEASEAAPALNEESEQSPPNNQIQNAEKKDNETPRQQSPQTPDNREPQETEEEPRQQFPQDLDNSELQETEEVETENGTESEVTAEEAASESEEQTEEELGVYRKHGFRGQWEDPSAVASEARSLYAGELSRVISTKKAFRLLKVDRKRTYRGDIYFYGADQYSYDRKNASRIGRRWNLRWGHTQSFYTPWDNRQEGRRPISFTGRVDWRALNYKEELKLPGESTLNSFGLLNYGSAFTTWASRDVDENNNLKFSRETIGDFAGRFEVRHIHDFTSEGTTSLQKLPQLTLNFSRMRFSGLPLFSTINTGMLAVSEKFKFDKPFLSLLAFPTLESTSFDMDIEFGNFFRQVYRGKQGEERDVFLQTLDLGLDLRKQSTLLITPLRELQLNMNLDTNIIWHDQDQEKNRNIVRGVYSLRGQATNTLFRIYKIRYIPGVQKLRHEIQSAVTYDYQPPVDENENLYPFGPSTYFYERKRLTYNFNTNIEIKTRRSQSAHRIFYFDTRLTADFTEFDPLYKRRYEPIESDLTFVPLPSRNLNMTVRFTHDPNPDPDDNKQFKMVGFRSNIRYTRQKWNVSLGNSFSKRHTSRRASRSITASGRYRHSQNLEFDVSVIYYPIEGQFYSQRVSINRNLHDWNLRISWNRVGIKRDPPYNNVRQDFTFQVSLIQEPAVSMGIGYDATTETWGLRTLPAGAPYNAFGTGNSLGRSFF